MTGVTQALAGGVAKIVKTWPEEVPPPGLGLTTVTSAVPAEIKSPTGTVAVISVALTQEHESGVPFHCTEAPLSKFEPNNATLTAMLPASAPVGAIVDREGISGGGWPPELLPLPSVAPDSPLPHDAASRTVTARQAAVMQHHTRGG